MRLRGGFFFFLKDFTLRILAKQGPYCCVGFSPVAYSCFSCRAGAVSLLQCPWAEPGSVAGACSARGSSSRAQAQ